MWVLGPEFRSLGRAVCTSMAVLLAPIFFNMTWTFYEYFVFETVIKITEWKGMGSARDGGWRHVRMLGVGFIARHSGHRELRYVYKHHECWLRSKPSSEVGVQWAGLSCSPVSGS